MRTPRSALLLLALTALAALVLLALAALIHDFVGTGLVTVAMAVPFAGVGTVVARRQPANPSGWFLLAIAVLLVVFTAGGAYAVYSYLDPGHPLPAARLGAFVSPFSWFMLLLLLPLPILLFPDGTLPSRRWRWPLLVCLAVWTVVIVSSLIVDSKTFTVSSIQVDQSGGLESLNTPTGWYARILAVAIPLYAVFAGSFVVCQILAFRRSSDERRAQLKWLLAGGAISVTGLSATITIGSTNSHAAELAAIAGFFAAAALPIAMGVGILKYRLYDIDRLISRTLSYAIVYGLLVAVFLGIVVVTTEVLPFSSPVGVAASTLAAAALFTPVRRRVQSRVDRRFNRARYDAEAIVSAFSARLRNSVDVGAVHAELLGAVDRAVEPERASVWVRS
jgi:hypothetical protein